VQQTPLPITVGTTPIIFSQFGAPVLYSAGTGLSLAGTVFSITNTGVSASTYGSASSVPVIAVNAQGQITSASSTSISIAASQITSGAVAVGTGGTGLTATPTNGQLLIGNGTGYSLSTLTAGTGVSVTNGSGSVTVTNTAPDQIVSLTGAGSTVVSGTYPNFTITSTAGTGTVTSVAASGGTTGLTFTGSPITTSGTLTLGGTLAVANGGTGATSLSSGFLLRGNGTSPVSASVVFDNGTNVGIGTSSPATLLDVNGVTTFRGSTNQTSGAHFTSNGEGLWMNGFASYGAGITSDAAGTAVRLWTSGSERMRITAAGGLAVGTTTDPGAGNIGLAAGARVQFSSSAYITPENNVSGAEISTPGAITFRTGSGPTERARISAAGGLSVGTTVDPGAGNIIAQGSAASTSVNSPAGTQLLRHNGSFDAGAFGASLNFTQRWWSGDAGFISVGQIAGVKEGSNGSFGGGLALFVAPSGSNTMSEAMRLSMSGNVGIGTSSPLRRLDIAGGGFAFTESGGAARNIHWGDTTNIYPVTITGDARSGSGFLSFNTNTFGNTAVERMRIDSGGNVSVGNSAIPYTTAGRTVFSVNGASSALIGLQSAGANRGYLYADGSVLALEAESPCILKLNAIGAQPMTFFTSNTERMRVTATGDVGIGTSAPNNRLQSAYSVPAAVPSAGAGAHGLAVGSSGFGLAAGALNNGNGYLQATRWDGAAANYNLLLQPNGGNVGIGTSAPGTRLDVIGNATFGRGGGTFQGITLTNSDNSASAETVSFIDARNNIGTADGDMFFGHQTNGGSYIRWATTAPGDRAVDRRVERFRISAEGVVTASVDIRAPIYYDLDNTAFYLDPASTSVTNVVRANDIQFSNGNAAITLSNATYNILRDPTGSIRLYLGGGGDPNSYYDNNAHIFRGRDTVQYGTISASGMFAPIFYDFNNSAYFLDATAATSLRTVGSWRSDSGAWDGDFAGKIQYHNNSWYFQYSNSFIFRANSGANVVYGDTVGNLWAEASVRSPIYYDNNNTNFYLDAAANSILNVVTVSANDTSAGGGMVFGGTANAQFIRGRNSDGASSTLSNLQLQSWFGIGFGPSISGQTVPIGENAAWIDVRQGDLTARRLLIAGQDCRAPIFYDSNDTSYYLNPAGYSQINGNGSVNGSSSVGLNIMGFSGNGAIMAFHRAGAFAVNMGLDTDNVIRIGGWSAAANRLQMDMSGNLTMAGNVTAFSDVRLKKDIETIDGALDLVSRMRGVRFTRIENDERNVGVVAQEMLEVLPEVVQQGVGDDDTLSVAYGNIVGVLIEAIKELTARVAELEGK
jgi:hypothetical protein